MLPAPSFLIAFAGATLVSAALTVVATLLGGADADLESLGREVRALDDPVADGGSEQ